MSKYLLSERFVENITPVGTPRFRPDAYGRLEVSDTRAEGLCLRVSPRGLKSWSFLYRVPERVGNRFRAGAQRRITMGTYPALSLREARDMAIAYREDVMAGLDPAATAPAPAKRVGEVIDTYLKVYLAKKVKCIETPTRLFTKHVKPHWETRLITDITRGDCHELIDLVQAKTVEKMGSDGKGAARETMKAVHALFVWAVDRELVAVNPMYRMRRDDLVAPKDVRTPLTDKQIRQLWQLTNLHRTLPQLQLILLTGCRKGEWAKARWDHIDMKERILTIPLANHKGKRETLVPLCAAAMAILETIPRRKPQVFGTYLSTGHLLPAHRDLGWRLRPHDLRSTCVTRMAQLGIPPNVVQLCVGQVPGGLWKIYNKYDYLKERQEAFDRYGEHIMEVLK